MDSPDSMTAAAGARIGPLEIRAPIRPGYTRVLSHGAAEFLAGLAREFSPRVDALLAARRERQTRFGTGTRPGFLPETEAIREGDWQVAPLPPDLTDRRVEITGPVDRKMIINALNSGASVFMADFEDSNTPTWDNQIAGQLNLMDAVRREIRYESPEGRVYAPGEKTAVLMVRPRGWHLLEKHVLVDGRPVPGGLFDFGLYFFHNAVELISRGTGPYFYLPKLESRLEARLWNDVFLRVQSALGIPRGTIRATVLIETLPAVFEMDEILHELREHSAGLNCGRWDYIFSFIKTFREDPARVLPDRSRVTMTQPFLRAYSRLLIRTCHRRGAPAMGGMAAQIPIKGDARANDEALDRVRADKRREVEDGHDGTWVAHPALVPIAREIFDAGMPAPNQIGRPLPGAAPDPEALLTPPQGQRTIEGLRYNVDVALRYLAAWLGGSGCVPIHHLMEDAATAEISRTQIWQWIRHGAALEGGEQVTAGLVRAEVEAAVGRIGGEGGAGEQSRRRLDAAAGLFLRGATGARLEEFLTLTAYDWIVGHEFEREGAGT